MSAEHWVDVCHINDLLVNDGVCALIEDRQIALFKIKDPFEIYAIGNYDPIGQANVLSRWIVGDGDINGELVVASPLYKQHFSLLSGQCLEDSRIRVPVYSTQITDGVLRILVEQHHND